MPSECDMLDNVLVRARDRKSSKKCGDDRCGAPKHIPKPCEVDCCIPDCNPDCCTPAFQRLDKLRLYWLNIQLAANTTASANTGLPTAIFTRAGGPSVTAPVQSELTPFGSNQTTITSTTTLGNNEISAWVFVNQVRYLNYEECGKFDQVIGWTVDLQTGDLYFYQNLPDLGLTGMGYSTANKTTGDSRAFLLNTAPTSLTPYDRRKLQEMEPFWKLSLKAVERVRENPKTEGNICEIKDKCGNRFLVAVNRAVGQNGFPLASNSGTAYTPNTQGASVCDYNSRYSIVAVKLC